MAEEEVIRESVSNLRAAIMLQRTDIIRSILSTAAEYQDEEDLFGEEEEEEEELDEDDPYNILTLMLNYIDDDAGTCLHLATKLGYVDAARALLSAGADPTIPNKEGATPFDYCTDKDILIVYNEELLQAAASSNSKQLSRLLKAGVSPNASDGAASDNKALHWGASYGNADMVRILCEHNADVNITNSEGAVPLHDAVIRADMEILRILLEHGADTTIKAHKGPYKGQTAIDLAQDNKDISFLLLNYTDITKPSVSHSEQVSSGYEASENGDEVVPSLVESESDSLSDTSSVQDNGTPKALETVTEHQEQADIKVNKQPSVKAQGTENRTSPSVKSALNPSEQVDLDPALQLLWPTPQKMIEMKGTKYFPPSRLHVKIVYGNDTGQVFEQCELWQTLEAGMLNVGYTLEVEALSYESSPFLSSPGCIECHVNADLFVRPESYSVHITATKITITSSDTAGMWYGANTVLQILRLFYGRGIPQLQISDWPNLRYRGVMVDVSSGRVPKIETLLALVDILSSLKINQLQLYMQNTFVHPGHEAVWQNSTPYTASDILRLSKYCKSHYIELVPHQESLADFSKWLRHSQYESVKEHLNGQKPLQRSTSCLCATTPETVNLMSTLHSNMFSCCPSTRFAHVGLDMPPGFGTGRSQEMCEKHGKDEVYVQYLHTMQKSCSRHQRTLQFWVNPLHDSPEQLWNLPPNIVAMEYVDKVNVNLRKNCQLLSDSGTPYFICPATLSWKSLSGWLDSALHLLNQSIQAAIEFRALGVLITDWSALGHVNPLSVSYPAFIAGAGLAWSTVDMNFLASTLPAILNKHILLDRKQVIGEAMVGLGMLHSTLSKDVEEFEDDVDTNIVHPDESTITATTLFQLLFKPDDAELEHVSLETVQKVIRQVRQCQDAISKADVHCYQSTGIVRELDLVADWLLCACRVARALILAQKQSESKVFLRDLPPVNRTDLANRYLGLIEHHQRIWLLRNREGGLIESVTRLQDTLRELVPGNAQTV